MAPDLHLDPERLHVHGQRLTVLLDGLVPLPAVDAGTRAALPPAVLADLDRTAAAVARIGRELAELAATLHGTACAAADAERRSAGDLSRISADRS